ncbi:MAG: Sulfate transport system permease protein CysT [Myxococcaceae bacterium]|nr:Sulfate transport system permease protein CysT [Myxococcaceae bacterium]
MTEIAVVQERAQKRTSLIALPRMLLGKRRVLPGLLPTLGFTWFYLTALVLIPIGALMFRAFSLSWAQASAIITAPRTAASLALSFGAAFAAAILNTLVGTLVAWVLARYKFWGRSLVDAIVDLPFALPTSVAGIALTYVYSEHGWIGSIFAKVGLPIAFTRLGIVVALTFVGMPFVVRTVQPVVQELDAQLEEAAASLGATKVQTFFRVILPLLGPAIGAGFALSFARGVGEYGSVLFIAGNMPMKTEIAPLLIVSKLEQFDYAGAAVIGATMLAVSLALLLTVQLFERQVEKKFGGDPS